MIVDPVELLSHTFRLVLPSRFDSPDARVLVTAIGLQESEFMDRYQKGNGPARGLYQFERGGVRGVLTHAATARYAKGVCAIREITPTVDAVYARLALDDVLACAFARLNLWWHSDPLPSTADVAWKYYLKCWNPGKPRAADWPDNFAKAATLVAQGGEK